MKPSKGTFYLYAKSPKSIAGGKTFNSAEEFSDYLIREKMVSVVPWDDAGAYVRFSCTFTAQDEQEEDRVISELARRLEGTTFE